MEIDYPIRTRQDEGGELDDDHDASVEILDVVPSKKRGRTELASLWDKGEVNSYPKGKTKDQGMKRQREESSYGTPSSLKSCEEGRSMPAASKSLDANEHNVDTGDGAFLRATSLKCSNPHIVVRMQKSYLSGCLKVQGDFAKECVCASGFRNVNLQNSAGRTWPAIFSVDVYSVGKRQGRVSWKSFVQDNHLKVGDACVFELMKKGCEVPTFKVHIFRAEDAN